MAAVKVFHVCPPGPARAGLALAAGCRRSPQAPRARLERLRGPCGHALLILKTVLKVNLFPERRRGRYGLRPQRSWPGRGVPGPAGLALWAWCFPVGAALCPGARAPARGGAPGRWPGLPGRVVGASGLAGPGLRGFARPARFLLARGRVPRCGRLVVPGPRRRAPGAGPCAPRFAQPRCGVPLRVAACPASGLAPGAGRGGLWPLAARATERYKDSKFISSWIRPSRATALGSLALATRVRPGAMSPGRPGSWHPWSRPGCCPGRGSSGPPCFSGSPERGAAPALRPCSQLRALLWRPVPRFPLPAGCFYVDIDFQFQLGSAPRRPPGGACRAVRVRLRGGVPGRPGLSARPGEPA